MFITESEKPGFFFLGAPCSLRFRQPSPIRFI